MILYLYFKKKLKIYILVNFILVLWNIIRIICNYISYIIKNGLCFKLNVGLNFNFVILIIDLYLLFIIFRKKLV